MNLTGLLDVVLADPAVRAAVDSAGVSALDLAAPAALRPFVVAALAADVAQGGAARPVLAVTATGREAEDLVSALCCLLPPTSVAFSPSWETLPHERLSPRADTVGRRLSKTLPFHWRRQHTVLEKTIFNYVATFNPFETAFAEFLQQCKDVRRFAALAEHFTGFWVDYLKPSGAISRYFPDWVAVQKTADGDVNWIVEAKGRVWEGTEQKDAAIRYWCSQVTDLTDEPWKYMRVDQPISSPTSSRATSTLSRSSPSARRRWTPWCSSRRRRPPPCPTVLA